MPGRPRPLTHKGQTLPLSQWADRAGIPSGTIRSRLDVLGWPVARALTTPADPKFARGGRPRLDMPRPCPAAKRHASGQAWARWSVAGRSYCRYFGAWGSDEARSAYARFVAEWAQGLAEAKSTRGGLIVRELAIAYLQHADRYYRKAGRRTSEYAIIRAALRALNALAGDKLVADVAADDLRNLQTDLAGKGVTRKTVNEYVGRVVRMLGWGAGQTGAGGRPFVPVAVLGQVQNVARLQPGRSRAPDRPRVESVPWADVKRTLPHLHADPARRAVLEAAVRVHWLTGVRSTELLSMRPEALDASKREWRYTVPASVDKQAHRRGGRPSVYWLGPKAQAVLRPLLASCPDGRAVFALPPRLEGGRWVQLTRDAYRRFIQLACRAAGVPHWHPHRIRHSRATEVERIYEDSEAAAHAIGDSPEVARRVYVDPNETIRRRIARETG